MQAGGHRFDPDWLHQLYFRRFNGFSRAMCDALNECNADRMGASAPPLFNNLTECGKRNASNLMCRIRERDQKVYGPRLIGVIWSSD